jgi:transcriptional regulator with XRE-family HTH domain
MTKERLRTIIGRNIRRERMKRKVSASTLAELVNVSPAYIRLLERGGRGTTVYNLNTLADFFGVPLEKMLEEEMDTEEKDARAGKLKLLDVYAKRMTDNELDYLLDMVAGLRKLLAASTAAMED